MALLEVKDLRKTYGNGSTAVTALAGVSLSVNVGEFVAVMGPSGCGKSTLLHLMGGLDRPTNGDVVIDGEALARLSDDALTKLRRRKIGFVFQFFNLIPVLSATENAAVPVMLDGVSAKQAKTKARAWLERVGLGNRMDSTPDQLSGGQQQRVAVARALVAEPKLILADEPTGNLDTRASQDVVGLLEQAASEWQRAVVMVTHDPNVAARAHRLLYMRDGEIVFEMPLNAADGDGASRVMDAMRALTREA